MTSVNKNVSILVHQFQEMYHTVKMLTIEETDCGVHGNSLYSLCNFFSKVKTILK